MFYDLSVYESVDGISLYWVYLKKKTENRIHAAKGKKCFSMNQKDIHEDFGNLGKIHVGLKQLLIWRR